MLKLLNILVIAYLAVAPGMNVEVLLHSVELCHATESLAVQPPDAHAGCTHHAPVPDEPSEHSGCPHLTEAAAPSSVMPAVQPASSVELPCPYPGPAPEPRATDRSAGVSVLEDAQPPPWLGQTTILIL
jgi:hypothetical protein